MMFIEYVNVLECLAGSSEGMTVRQIAKKSMMENQRVETTLKHLETEMMVTKEILPHRPNINKRVWKINGNALVYCHAVNRAYDDRNKS